MVKPHMNIVQMENYVKEIFNFYQRVFSFHKECYRLEQVQAICLILKKKNLGPEKKKIVKFYGNKYTKGNVSSDGKITPLVLPIIMYL